MHEQTKAGIKLYWKQEDSPTREILTLFEAAAAEGCVHARYCMAVCHEMGIGTEKDEDLAINYYHEAAECGHLLALNNLAILFFFHPADDDEPEIALEHWLRAGRGGLAAAWVNAGSALMTGRKVSPDKERAFRLYQLAAELGHPLGICSMGRCYLHGEGVAKNRLLGKYLLIKGILIGLWRAGLGQLDACGMFQPKNYDNRAFFSGTLNSSLDELLLQKAMKRGLIPLDCD